MPAATVDLVLFDLGGVVADFRGIAGMRALTGVSSDDELRQRWSASPAVRRFERGDSAPEDFAAGVVAEWGLPMTPAEYLEVFRDWLDDPTPEAEDLVAAVAGQARVACLSNTNVVHWEAHISRWPLTERFEHRFLSFELGRLKPDRDIFDHVVAASGVAPARILFLDDTPANVDAARAAGFRAIRVRGVAEARTALADAGVLHPLPP